METWNREELYGKVHFQWDDRRVLGWEGLSNSGSSYISHSMQYTVSQCDQYGHTFQQWNFSNFIYYDQAGAHFFSATGVYFQNSSPCGPPTGEQAPQPPQPLTVPT